MDILTPEQRHKNMQQIRSKDTKPEIVLRKALWHKGYRYRKNYKLLPGKPDIVLTKQKICIFVDSEFFHGKGFMSGYESKKYNSLREQLEHSTRPEFWLNKIQLNMQRDLEIDTKLYGLGWSVLHFWSKDVLRHTENCVQAVEEMILSQQFEDKME